MAAKLHDRARVLVSGYYGFNNAGDEAILYALVQALRRRRTNLELTVLSAMPEATAQTYGVHSIPRRQLPVVLREMRRTDLFIMGGGGLLQDTTSLASLQYYLGLVAMADACGRKVFFYGQGIGPIRTGVGRRMTRTLVNRVAAITVRDEESRRELAEIGVRRPRITVTADPVLGIEPEPAWMEQGRFVLDEMGLAGAPVAGISMRPWPSAPEYVHAVAAAGDRLAGEGWRVLFLPFHHPGDLEVCRETAALMRAPATVLEKPCDFSELIGICTHLDLAIGMRLHFLVFAVLAGVPLVGLPYDPKVSRFLGRLGLDPGLPGVITPEDIAGRLAYVFEHRAAVQATMQERLIHLRRAALATADLAVATLDRQLGSCI
ncbi:MAG: polysaccharide pyruvyl transferase CsaB [Desulforudis sp.]|nr:polysaccharide pyruvyl transferase CsaB [Clostridia bacterium]MDQ7792158.1 polysaccharide pyruvyl transferase CsaB [Clostridia bacterium]RJX19576.1 MAG: polysaccharide pyruvyl transferase CsaB [Desulforudis sp.]